MSISNYESMVLKIKRQIVALDSKLVFYEDKLAKEKVRAAFLSKHPAGSVAIGSSHWKKWIKKHDIVEE